MGSFPNFATDLEKSIFEARGFDSNGCREIRSGSGIIYVFTNFKSSLLRIHDRDNLLRLFVVLKICLDVADSCSRIDGWS